MGEEFEEVEVDKVEAIAKFLHQKLVTQAARKALLREVMSMTNVEESRQSDKQYSGTTLRPRNRLHSPTPPLQVK